jgi:hypothetical protein
MRFLARLLLVLGIAVAQPAAASERSRVEIVDFGIYDHRVDQIVKDPKELARERSIVSGIRLRLEAIEIDAQPGRMFGYQFRIVDPRLAGETLVLRKTVPRLTNPATGESATVMESELVANPGTLHLNAYGFDYDWEMAEGYWTFEVLHKGAVLATKRFKIILPMN